MSNSTLSILIVSCDRYADVWPTFFSLFWKYWPDCPFPLYLGANQQSYKNDAVNMVLTGDDPSWAESTRRMVEQVPSQYILVMLEDFFLRQPVETSKIQDLLGALDTLGGGYLRLRPRFSRPDIRLPAYPEIGEIAPGAPYRAALQAALWRKDVLLSLLHSGESAWDMEILGSRRSDQLSAGFYSTWKPAIDYYSAITRGKWLPEAIEHCKREGIACNASRPTMTQRESNTRFFSSLRGRAVSWVPWQYRRNLKNWLKFDRHTQASAASVPSDKGLKK